jgi:hypothetical protein
MAAFSGSALAPLSIAGIDDAMDVAAAFAMNSLLVIVILRCDPLNY